MKKFWMVAACICAACLACACSVALAPGDHEGATPPRMAVKNSAKTWDNAGSFGQIPAALVADAKRICATMNTNDQQYEAVGYHSRAEDLEGQPIPGGGYLCVKQRNLK